MDHATKFLWQCVGFTLTIAPLAFWAALYFVVGHSHSIPAAVLPAIRALRWMGWLSGMVLFVAYFTGFHHFHLWPLASGFCTFSIGLSLPERWAREPNPRLSVTED